MTGFSTFLMWTHPYLNIPGMTCSSPTESKIVSEYESEPSSDNFHRVFVTGKKVIRKKKGIYI